MTYYDVGKYYKCERCGCTSAIPMFNIEITIRNVSHFEQLCWKCARKVENDKLE